MPENGQGMAQVSYYTQGHKQLIRSSNYPLVMSNIAIENGPIEIVAFPMNSMVDLSIVFCKRLPGRVRDFFCYATDVIPKSSSSTSVPSKILQKQQGNSQQPTHHRRALVLEEKIHCHRARSSVSIGIHRYPSDICPFLLLTCWTRSSVAWKKRIKTPEMTWK